VVGGPEVLDTCLLWCDSGFDAGVESRVGVGVGGVRYMSPIV
jgi:hypothetical protein